jgi:hypothetical protein
LPENLIIPLQAQLQRAQLIHERNLKAGFGEVYLPHALAVKYPNAGKAWGWQYGFPAALRAMIREVTAWNGATMCFPNRCSVRCGRARGAWVLAW